MNDVKRERCVRHIRFIEIEMKIRRGKKYTKQNTCSQFEQQLEVIIYFDYDTSNKNQTGIQHGRTSLLFSTKFKAYDI